MVWSGHVANTGEERAGLLIGKTEGWEPLCRSMQKWEQEYYE
jgi:hypothetical protein